MKKKMKDSNKKMMLSELEVLRLSTHPNIMEVYELLEDEGHYYIVSEILEGGELYKRFKKDGPFEEKKAALIIK